MNPLNPATVATVAAAASRLGFTDARRPRGPMGVRGPIGRRGDVGVDRSGFVGAIGRNDNEDPIQAKMNSSSSADEPEESNLISQCSKLVQAYIEATQLKERMSDKINALNVTEEEKPLFEQFEDPISYDYMDVPVSLNETYYDISTLIKWKRKDPLTRAEYNPLELQSGRTLLNKLDGCISELKAIRAKKKQLADQAKSSSVEQNNTSVSVPGGPSIVENNIQ